MFNCQFEPACSLVNFEPGLPKVQFYAIVIFELVFTLIVNFQHTILSLFMFTAACLFRHLFFMEAVALYIIKPSFSCFAVNSRNQRSLYRAACAYSRQFTVGFRCHIFYISYYKQKLSVEKNSLCFKWQF